MPFFAVTVSMSNDYVHNFTTSFQNLLPRANSAYISVTDKSTIAPAYPLTIIQNCTFSPIYLLSGMLEFSHKLVRDCRNDLRAEGSARLTVSVERRLILEVLMIDPHD